MSRASRQWLAGFALSFTITLALSRPEKVQLTLLLFPVVFWGLCLGGFLWRRLRAARDRR